MASNVGPSNFTEQKQLAAIFIIYICLVILHTIKQLLIIFVNNYEIIKHDETWSNTLRNK